MRKKELFREDKKLILEMLYHYDGEFVMNGREREAYERFKLEC